MRLVSWLWGFATSLRRPGGDSLWSPSWQASASLFGGFGRATRSGEEVTAHTAGALPAVYRACSFISDALASVELRVVQEQSDGGKKPVEDTDAARTLADWSFPSRELFIWHAALGGNGFAVIRSNARGGAKALEPIVPRRITALRDESGALFYGILPLPSMGKAEPELVPAEEMIHLRFRNIGDVVGETVFGIAPNITSGPKSSRSNSPALPRIYWLVSVGA